MEGRGIVWSMVLRTAGYTFAAGAIVGALYAVCLYVALTFFDPDGSIRSAAGTAGGNMSIRYDPANLPELGPLGVVLGHIMVVVFVAVAGGFTSSLVLGIAGAVAGLITGLMTAAAFSPITLTNRRQFERIVTTAGVGSTAALASVLGPQALKMVARIDANSGSFGAWLVGALAPTLVAAVAAWWASRHVAEWYEDEYLDSSMAAG